MNLKQRISFFNAAALPLLALTAFLLYGPQKAQAFDDCPDGGIYAPGGPGCEDGHDSGVPYNSSGVFVFCPFDDQCEYGGAGGWGYCDSYGCVHCQYCGS